MAEPIEIVVGLADHPGLELLNTRAIPVPGAAPIELIADGRSYLRWLDKAGLISGGDRASIRQAFDAAAIDNAAADARGLRDWLRPRVIGWTADPQAPIPSGVLTRLNALLGVDHRVARLQRDDHESGLLTLRDQRRWEHPDQLLVPPAEAVAHLFADDDPALIRQCQGCAVLFYDRTKAHRRKWCSMALCGNRDKVRRFRSARADSDPSPQR